MGDNWCLTQTIMQRMPVQSISLSENGAKLAISMNERGVRMFTRSGKGFGEFAEFKGIGNDKAVLQSSSDLSENGDIIAINGGSATKAFKHNGTEWNEYGSAMRVCKGAVEKDVSLSLSSDGKILAVSANCGNDTFITQVFQYSEKKVWKNFGQTINGGRKMQLSGDGTFVVNSYRADRGPWQCVQIYQNAQKKLKKQWCAGTVQDFAFTKSGGRLAISWNAEAGGYDPSYIEELECNYAVQDLWCNQRTRPVFDSAINPQFDTIGTTIAYADTSQSNIKVRNFETKTTHQIGSYTIPIFAMSKTERASLCERMMRE